VESVENSKSEFPTLSTGLGKSGKKSAGFPTFPPRRRRFYIPRRTNHEPQNKFQLTDLGYFQHYSSAPASRRSDRDGRQASE
jgi:hypothetical protein